MMSPYDKIYNPLTKRFVDINSKMGHQILQSYIGGGSRKLSSQRSLKRKVAKKPTRVKNKKIIKKPTRVKRQRVDKKNNKKYKNYIEIEKMEIDKLWDYAIVALKKKDYDSLKIICFHMLKHLKCDCLPSKMKNISIELMLQLKTKVNDNLLPSVLALYNGTSNTINCSKMDVYYNMFKYLPKLKRENLVDNMFIIVYCHEMVHFLQIKGNCKGPKTFKRSCWMESQATSVASALAKKYKKQYYDNFGKKFLYIRYSLGFITKKSKNMWNRLKYKVGYDRERTKSSGVGLPFLRKCYLNNLKTYSCKNNGSRLNITKKEDNDFHSGMVKK